MADVAQPADVRSLIFSAAARHPSETPSASSDWDSPSWRVRLLESFGVATRGGGAGVGHARAFPLDRVPALQSKKRRCLGKLPTDRQSRTPSIHRLFGRCPPSNRSVDGFSPEYVPRPPSDRVAYPGTQPDGHVCGVVLHRQPPKQLSFLGAHADTDPARPATNSAKSHVRTPGGWPGRRRTVEPLTPHGLTRSVVASKTDQCPPLGGPPAHSVQGTV